MALKSVTHKAVVTRSVEATRHEPVVVKTTPAGEAKSSWAAPTRSLTPTQLRDRALDAIQTAEDAMFAIDRMTPAEKRAWSENIKARRDESEPEEEQ